MAKNKKDDKTPPEDLNAKLETTSEDKAKAKKWFLRARELGEKRQFDYAIEYYVNGLEFWPDAVEDACKPLHGCAVARRQTGGKKPGFKDSMKRSLNDKDARKAFMNALWLFGHDPESTAYLEGIVKTSNRLRADHAAMWAGSVCLKALEGHAKSSIKQFIALAGSLDEVGERAAKRGDVELAVEAYELGVQTLSNARRKAPSDNALETALRNLSTKLTITKGKYEKGDSFRDSVRDGQEQKDLHDRQLSVQTEDRWEELVAKAEAEHEENPDDKPAFKRLIDLLCRPEKESGEKKAMGFLVAQFKRTEEYSYKEHADDIRMKQLARRVRAAIKSGDQAVIKETQIASLKFDLAAFKDRVARYPTDNRVKFEYGTRLFRAGRFDDTIPVLQAARSDPKNKTLCSLYLGRCFFKKSYYSQAISTFQEELKAYAHHDDDLAKKMSYWLGRAQQESGDIEAARDTYGKILQIDYNYQDVRDRLDSLPESN